MNAKGKKNKKKLNLLEMSDSERKNVVEKLRQMFRRNVVEAKLWNWFLQCETLTINGEVVFSRETAFDGAVIA
ncbi:MAG: hypothetical protein QW667_04800 [Candidatus Bathyarchaeia archaeon]